MSVMFHPLRVRAIEPDTQEAVIVSFDVPTDLREVFGFTQGQYLTLRTDIDGQDLRRSYSICAGVDDGELRVGVRKVRGGVFSNWINEHLKPGDTVNVMAPQGRFFVPIEPQAQRHHVGIAGGSGITPILSIMRTTMEIETGSRFTLFYGNRTAESTMFATELEELEARYADRLRVVHIRSAEAHHPTALRGRIDLPMVQRLLAGSLNSIDRWYLCGPSGLVTTLRDDLASVGVPTDRVHLELFRGTGQAIDVADYPPADVTITLSGAEHTVGLTAGETVLESALKNDIDAPYACLGGACGTCKAKLITGAVSMEQNFALNTAEVEAGFILTCQSHPTTPTVAVDYDC